MVPSGVEECVFGETTDVLDISALSIHSCSAALGR